MNLQSQYAPTSFSLPVLCISTIFNDKWRETAVCFVEALNGGHAMKIVYGDEPLSKKTEWIAIKQHKTQKSASEFHIKLASKMVNGCSEKEWQKGMKKYMEIYDGFYPKELIK